MKISNLTKAICVALLLTTLAACTLMALPAAIVGDGYQGVYRRIPLNFGKTEEQENRYVNAYFSYVLAYRIGERNVEHYIARVAKKLTKRERERERERAYSISSKDLKRYYYTRNQGTPHEVYDLPY